MPRVNTAKTNNVTVIPQRSDNLHQTLDLMRMSQINSEYIYGGMAMAGPLLTEVGKLFPTHMILIYMTTSYKRRQVWNSYIATMFANPAKPKPITDPEAVRTRLLIISSKELLVEAYGSVPAGMVRVLGLLGLEGQQPQTYIQLHEQMEKSATLCKEYSHASKIDASTVTTIAALPEYLKNYDLAKQFKKPEDVKKLVFAVDMLSQDNKETYIELCEKIVTAAKSGHSVGAVLKREYYALPFPVPIAQSSDQCRHIDSAHKMMVSAKRFNNCLKTYIFEAVRNDLQYYEYLVDSSPIAVISIKNDRPLGWRIVEVKLKDNGLPEEGLMTEINSYFERFNVFAMPSFEALIGQVENMFEHDHRNFSENIDDFIDGLLDEAI